jgi:hypothetical protein
VKKLLEQRAALVAKMRAITAAPAGTNGDLSAEQSTQFDAFKTELDGIEAKIQRQQVLDDAERRMQGQPVAGSGDNRLDSELRNFSLRAAIAGASGMNVEWGRERELSAETAKRAGRPFQGVAVPMQVFHRAVEHRDTVLASGSGGNLIATDFKGDQFIDMLRAALVIRRLGARVLSGLTGNVDIPKQTSAATSGWVAEDSGLSFSDPEFSKVQMTPKHAGCITEFSRNMLLRRMPVGSSVPPPLMATLSTASVVRKLRSTAKVSSTDSVMIMQSPNELAGYPATSSNLVPNGGASAHKLIFGNFADVLLGYWSELDILVNPYESTAYAKGNIQVRGMLTCDVAIRHIESFAASVDVAVS